MSEKLYKIRYKVIDYKFTQEVNINRHSSKLKDGETTEEFCLMDIHEKIVNEEELLYIKMQAEEGLTIIEDVKLINPELLPPMERIALLVDQKGKPKGHLLKKRND